MNLKTAAQEVGFKNLIISEEAFLMIRRLNMLLLNDHSNSSAITYLDIFLADAV